MTTDALRAAIERAGPELRAAGVSALYLFGSRARGDAREDSDVDLAFDITDEANEQFSLIDQAHLQLRLQDILGCKVDFIERRAIHRDLRPRIEHDMIRIL